MLAERVQQRDIVLEIVNHPWANMLGSMVMLGMLARNMLIQ